MTSLGHATHPQRGAPRGNGPQGNFMTANLSSNSLVDNSSSHTRSMGSIKTFVTLPPGAVVIPINFGVKYRPAKLGLEYKLETLPDQLCIYEVTLTSYIEQGMGTAQIVDLIFDLHGEFINPKTIARNQVTRLVDRVLARAAPDLIYNRNNENKENSSRNNEAQEETPAKPHSAIRSSQAVSSGTRQSLALQLNSKPVDSGEPLLEQAPESERSDAFSMPASEEGNSARQGFNQVQNLKMTGPGKEVDSSGKKSTSQALDNLEINLDERSDLRISEIQVSNQPSGKQHGEDDIDEMEKLLNSGGAFGGKDLSDTFKKMGSEFDGLDESAQQSGRDDAMGSELDLQIPEAEKVAESPGQNTFVQNQINQLTGLEAQAVQQQQEEGFEGQSDSNIDIDNLTESQLIALQEQAAAQEFQDGGMDGEEGEDDEVIDVDNPEDLAKKGLRRIQIEGDEQEYLLDNEGNIYNLQGEFVGTTGDEDGEQGEDEEEGQAE